MIKMATHLGGVCWKFNAARIDSWEGYQWRYHVMKQNQKQVWLDLVSVGLHLGLDKGLRSQRKDATHHLSQNERIARRVRRLIKSPGGLRAIRLPGVGYRVHEDWLREYEIGLEMDAERARKNVLCGQNTIEVSENEESQGGSLSIENNPSKSSISPQLDSHNKPHQPMSTTRVVQSCEKD